MKRTWRCTALRTGAEATGLGKVSRESEACWIQRVAGDWLGLLGEANQDKDPSGTYRRLGQLPTAHRSGAPFFFTLIFFVRRKTPTMKLRLCLHLRPKIFSTKISTRSRTDSGSTPFLP